MQHLINPYNEPQTQSLGLSSYKADIFSWSDIKNVLGPNKFVIL